MQSSSNKMFFADGSAVPCKIWEDKMKIKIDNPNELS